MQTNRHIVAMGGGGFLMEPDNPLLDRYILSLSNKERPRICFVGTASGDSKSASDRFMKAFSNLPCEPTELSLFRCPPNLREFVMSQDIFYVGGGNTRNLLVLWKEWGLDMALREAYDAGKIMAGISAGAICWFENGLSDSVVTGEYRPLKALGWIKESFCPHWNGEAGRQEINKNEILNKNLSAGWAADDGVAVHFVNEQVHRVVSSHPELTARKFQAVNNELFEEVIEPGYLGGGSTLIRKAALKDVPGIHESHMRSIREVCSRDHTSDEIRGWGNRPLSEDFAKRRAQMIQEGCVYVVEHYGKIAGSGVAFIKADQTAYIAGLYLCPEVIGKNYGQRILDLLEDYAQSKGATKVELESTLTAKNFYLKNGYRVSGDIKISDFGGSQVRGWPMIKELK